MKNKTLTLALISVSLVSLSLISTPVYAQTTNGYLKNGMKNIETRSNPNGELKTEMRTERCTMIETRIDDRLKFFNDTKDTREKIYGDTVQRVQNIVTALKNKGYDTTKLETDLKTLNDKIKTFWADLNTFMDQLQNTKSFACGTSNGQFAQALQTAKGSLKTVRMDSENIRLFFQNTIRVDIKNIRAQKIKTTESTSSN